MKLNVKNKILNFFRKDKRNEIELGEIPIKRDMEETNLFDNNDISKKKNNFNLEVFEKNNGVNVNRNMFKEQMEINALFDTVINILTNKICLFITDEDAFYDYKTYNSTVFFRNERNQIKKYLKRFFKLRKFSLSLKINETYKELDEIVNKISDILNIPKFESYEQFMKCSDFYYNYTENNDFLVNKNNENSGNKSNLKKSGLFDENIVNNKNNADTSKNVKNDLFNDNKVNKKNTKKVIVSPEVDNLNSSRRKLLNKVKKLDNQLFDSSEKVDTNRKEILVLKKNILSIEKQIYILKQNDEKFKNTIDNSKEIRKQNCIKEINVYLNQLKHGKVKCCIENYFGIEQIEYFKSLGIDIENCIDENLKVKSK